MPGYGHGVPGLENEGFMTILTRLEQWKEQGKISAEQHAHLAGLARGEPLSLFLELNVLLYAGVLAFVGGLGWTVSTWSQQLGDVLVLTVLSTLLAASFWYCFSRAPAWSPAETPAPSPLFDYVLYLGSLVWSLELGYIENRFHVLSGQLDLYLLATAGSSSSSLIASTIASCCRSGCPHSPDGSGSPSRTGRPMRTLRIDNMRFNCLLVGGGGALLQRRGLKPHFFGTYLNIVANVLFWALLSGVFDRQDYGLWFLALLIACGASLAWGLTRRQFVFVAYAAVYGYAGVSSLFLRGVTDTSAVLSYFVVSGVAMLVVLVQIGRRFGRSA
jgi:hypothetical protein